MAEETEFIPPADIKASEYQTWKALKDIIRKLASAKKTEITKLGSKMFNNSKVNSINN